MEDGRKFFRRLLPGRSQKKSKMVEETVKERIRTIFYDSEELESTPLIVQVKQEPDKAESESVGVKPIQPNLELLRIYRHIKLLNRILLLDVLQNFQGQLKELHTIFRGDEFSPWEKKIDQLNVNLKHQVVSLIKGGEIDLEKSLQQEFMDELMSLPPLEQFYVSDGNEVELEGALLSLIEGLKEDVKKGNRANFKGIHELESKFEQFVEQVQADKQEVIREAVQDMKEQNSSVRNLVFDLFDQLDAVYQAVLHIGNNDITKQVEKVIDNSLRTLESYGYEEINVLGEFINGKTMISLGSVPRKQYAPELLQNQVYTVHQRGFKDKNTKEILRKATVITID
jgi:hypothetical protein